MISSILRAYQISYKRSIGHTSFNLMYGQEGVIPLHFKQQSPTIAQVLHLDVVKYVKDRIFYLTKLEEQCMIAIHHEHIQNKQQKAWHDRNI